SCSLVQPKILCFITHWAELKNKMTAEYCPRNELQKMEVEFSRQETVRARAYAADPTEGRGYAGNLPLCNKCKLHHTGPCKVRCRSCQKVGHQSKDCRGKAPATTSKTVVTCFGCGEMGHYKNKCHKKKGQQVTGTFLLNNHYATVLFDSGADKSFVLPAVLAFLVSQFILLHRLCYICIEVVVS
nr:hypothetical protein [Tanacetum cinerariifolium]